MIKSEDMKAVRNFASAIIHQAVYDWCKRPGMKPEIREFFKSKYCEELCEIINLSATKILDRLENNNINRQYLQEV